MLASRMVGESESSWTHSTDLRAGSMLAWGLLLLSAACGEGDPLGGVADDLCISSCARDHASTFCGSAGCEIVQCDSGWGDCNRAEDDGCEANIRADLNHCGTCGNACATGSCSRGSCLVLETLAPGGPGIHSVAVSEEFVYWTEVGSGQDDGRVMRAPKAGGEPVVLAGQLSLPVSLTVDAGSSFWFELTEDTNSYRLLALPEGTSSIVPVAEGLGSPRTYPIIRGSVAYWGASGDGSGSLFEASVDGDGKRPLSEWSTPGTVRTLAGAPNGLVFAYADPLGESGGGLVRYTLPDHAASYLSHGIVPELLLVHGGYVYGATMVQDGASRRLFRLPLEGGEEEQLWEGERSFGFLTATGESLFLVEFGGDSAVFRFDLATGRLEILAGGQLGIGNAVTDGVHLYFSGDGEIRRIAL